MCTLKRWLCRCRRKLFVWCNLWMNRHIPTYLFHSKNVTCYFIYYISFARQTVDGWNGSLLCSLRTVLFLPHTIKDRCFLVLKSECEEFLLVKIYKPLPHELLKFKMTILVCALCILWSCKSSECRVIPFILILIFTCRRLYYILDVDFLWLMWPMLLLDVFFYKYLIRS